MDSKALAARLSKKYETRDPFRLADEMGFIVVFAPSLIRLICVGSSSASSGKI